MDFEEKFLDPEYLATRIRDFKEIRRGDFAFRVDRSDTPGSPTLYVHFLGKNNHERQDWVYAELRVSDHIIATNSPQFIVERGAILSKKKKEQFIRLVEKCIKIAKARKLAKDLKKI